MTSTMLETYDTQMLDYPTDLDVQMHGSSETWMVEAVMEDDIHQVHSSKALDTENASVEVDMDAEEGVEYEMHDGVENYDHPLDEPVDVEVYDASDTPAELLLPSDPSFTEISHSVSFSSTIQSPHPEVGLQPSAPSAPNPSEAQHSHAPEPVEPSFSDIQLATAGDPEHGEAPYFVETTVPIEIQPSTSDVLNVEPLLDDTQAVDGPSVTDSFDAEPAEFPSTVEEQEKPRGEAGYHDSVELSINQSEVHDQALDDQQELHESNSAASTGDPHEISEGVYIDPPPAVVLSFPDTDSPDVYLFNHPPTSGSATPIDSNSHEAPGLMLHNQPTLYYEPVTSIFEALRLESHIGRVADLVEGELALEAYELQLMIVEDNIYAREVSLHDLNVLHDGSDIPGPLRLRLHSVVPRFIFRYHQLQDHVSRLHITDPGPPVENISPDRHNDEDEEYLEPPVSDGDTSHCQDTENPVPEEARYTDSHEEIHGNYPNGHEIEDNAVPRGAGDTPAIGESGNASQNDQSAEGSDLTHHSISQGPETDPDAESSETVEPDPETALEDPEYGEAYNAQESEEYGERLLRENDSHEDYSHHESPVIHDEETTDTGATPRLDTPPLLPTDVLQNLGHEHSNDNGLEDTPGQNEIDHDSSSALHEIDVADDPLANDVGLDSLLAAPDATYIDDTTYPAGESFNTEGDNEEWDDDLDGEGDPDTTWEAENDTTSNQSSVTLSSTTSSKRSITEVDPDDENNGFPLSSPGSKRPRVD